MYSKQQGAAMVKYQRNRYRSWISNRFTQSKINLWFIVIGGLIDLKLIGWLIELLFRKSTWCNRTKNIGHYFFYNGMKRKKKKIDFSKIKKNNTWYWFRNLGVVAWAYFSFGGNMYELNSLVCNDPCSEAKHRLELF